jgi:cytosine/uracil/thiamine/allantoin permease
MNRRSEEYSKKENIRKAVRNLILGFSFLSGGAAVFMARRISGLEEFDYAFGIVIGAIVYVVLKRVTGYKGKHEQ